MSFYDAVLRLCGDQSNSDDTSKMEILRRFVAQGVNLNTRSFERNFSALQYAVWKKNVTVVRILLELGCDVNIFGGHEETALHLACGAGAMAIVVLLVRAKATIDCVTKYGMTPAARAAACGYHQVLQYLLENGASTAVGRCLFDGSACLYPRVIETLIAWKADYRGATPLHNACIVNNVETIQLLLDAGADIDAVDTGNGSAIFSAIFFDRSDNLAALLIAGARTDIFNHCGYGPTRFAFKSCACNCLRVLFAWQPDDIDYKDSAARSYSYYVSIVDIESYMTRSRAKPGAFGSMPGTVRRDIAIERKRLAKLLFTKITVPITNLAIALQSIGLPALVTLYIVNALYDTGERMPMHKKWQLVTAIKHHR